MANAGDKRRLAAILAADMTGYSRLMAADEAGTIARLKACREEIFQPAIGRRGGRLVKTAGDGLIAEFASVVDAVECAAEVQRMLARRNAELVPGRRAEFRIGIHLGDVVADGDDILGDDVNIAARLEAVAEPGGLVISRAVRDRIRDKLPYPLDDLGEVSVKNMPRPVRAFRVRVEGTIAPPPLPSAAAPARGRPMPLLAAGLAALLIAGGLALWRPWSTPPAPAPVPAAQLPAAPAPVMPPVQATAERPTIAVLPFANLSGDPQQEYFSDGISEDLLTALTRFSRLKVIGRNSSFRYKGQAVDLRKVGEELGARYVLEGSVRREGERVRITAQLIEAATGTHLWAEKYDRPFKDLFEIGDEVVNRVAGALSVQILAAETQRAQRRPLDNMDAYVLTLKGRARRNRGDRDSVYEARRLLEKAVELDPSYALAYAHLETVLTNFHNNRWNEEYASPAIRERMLAVTTQAFRLDPGSGFVMGRHAGSFSMTGRHDEAVAMAERAIASSPNDPDTLFAASGALQRSGKPARAVELLKIAMQLDPNYSPVWENTLAIAHFLNGELEEAIAAGKRCVAGAPTSTLCHVNLIAAFASHGRIDEARATKDALLRLSPNHQASGEAERRSGWRDKAGVQRFVAALRAAGVPE